jgi:hypothetical protein
MANMLWNAGFDYVGDGGSDVAIPAAAPLEAYFRTRCSSLGSASDDLD